MAILTPGLTHVDTANLNSTQFQIQADAALFSVLTQRIYTDTILAPIREWSTNAIDACIAASVDPHFDVHLPTVEDPTFSVRDYGTGLSQSDILGLFTMVGASTKRDSNDFNGQFGLGRLSALSYTDSFTIESYFNGAYYSYLISITEGIPVAIPLASTTTDEPNGLRLSLTANLVDIASFTLRAQKLYNYFDVKPTLNIPLDLDYVPLVSTDNWFIDGDSSNKLVMSNIVYTIPRDNRIDTHNLSSLVIKVPTGTVSINPGRESLSLDQLTIDYLNNQFALISDEYLQVCRDILSSEPSEYDRIRKYITLSNTATNELFKQVTLPLVHIPLQAASTYSWKVAERYLKDSLPFGKCAYYSSNAARPKFLNKCDVSIQQLIKSHIVAVDTKSNYSSAINAIAAVHKPLFLIYADNHATFRADFAQWLTDAGIPSELVHYTSDYAPTRTAAASPRDAGIYVCEVYDATIRANKLATADKYLYFELNGSTPTDPLFTAYAKFHDYFQSELELPPLVGVQQKYLSAVKSMDSFIPAAAYLHELANSRPYSTYVRGIEHNQLKPLISIPEYPAIVRTYLTEIAAFNEHSLGTIESTKFAEFAAIINTLPTEHKLTYSYNDIMNKYPMLGSFNYRSVAYRNYYFLLEGFYEANADPSQPLPTLPDY